MSALSSITSGSTAGRILMKNSIKVFRAKADITQEQLATALGVYRQTIIAIEKSKYVPSLTLAFKIARHFNVNVEEIFECEESDLK
jgi:putative transcriptional regulator